MPNHVANKVTFVGDKDEIRRVVASVKSDDADAHLSSIDFEKIIPMPDHIYRGDLGKEEREKYGENNWYDWRTKNWGTKWNAYGFLDDEIDDFLLFQTAWMPPIPVIKELSRKFPSLDVKLAYANEDIGIDCGEVIFKAGKIFMTKEYPEGSKEAIHFAEMFWGADPDVEEDYEKPEQQPKTKQKNHNPNKNHGDR